MLAGAARRPHRLSLLPLLAFALLAAPVLARAQASASATEIPYSRFDLYGGYGYFHPIQSGINGYQYTDISNLNATASGTYFFNRYVGVQIEAGYFNGPGVFNVPAGAGPFGCQGTTCYSHDQKVYTAEAGPELRWPLGRFVPFIHALGGGARINGPAFQPLTWGWGVTGGAGFDYVLPFFHNRFAIRPIQADFQYSQVVYGPLILPAGVTGGFGEIDALKLSGGLVARFGGWSAKPALMLGCTTEPATVFAGDPVTATATTLGTNPRRKATFTWTSTGGRVTPSGPAASIDTTGLAPGDYTVTGHFAEGPKAHEQANCTAPFSVRAYEPPTLTCAAVPASVESGAVVDINTVGTSPQNRPLTYSYTASAGLLTPSGRTARLATGGLGAQSITITCNVVDDFGKTATATTQLVVTAPAPPVVASTKDLCSIGFVRDQKRPARVDNEAKGCLDDVALTMNAQSDAKLDIVGNTSPDERPEVAAQRAMNTRAYLTQEKGIDPARIEVRVGDTSGRTVRNVLVPAGAIFNDKATQTFDERAIPASGPAYGTASTSGAFATQRKSHRRRPRAATPSAANAPAPLPPATDATH